MRWEATSFSSRFLTPNFNPLTPCGVRPITPTRQDMVLQFQSTHPVWDGTRDASEKDDIIAAFQSTHPVWDGTGALSRVPCAISDFNPPIPCGMGQPCPRWLHRCQYFNPPIPCGMGRLFHLACVRRTHHFNPPIPCGMGHGKSSKKTEFWTFQSTHPVWDGTKLLCDLQRRSLYFNPPIPCGMGPPMSISTQARFAFQSTHPVWDGTGRKISASR